MKSTWINNCLGTNPTFIANLIVSRDKEFAEIYDSDIAAERSFRESAVYAPAVMVLQIL